MCFRPAEAEKAKNICMKCKTLNPPFAKACKSCGAELKGLPPLPGQSGGLASQTSKKPEE